jgi:DNA mismatch endonuclease (patch repair protein)
VPDLVFPSRRVALFVHGCFWHGHSCKRGARVPKTNVGYWQKKIAGNRARDTANGIALKKAGWRVRIIWECQLKDPKAVLMRMRAALGPSPRRKRVLGG